MPLRLCRVLTLTLVALSMGMSFAHVMEFPAKRAYDHRFYAAVNSSLYGAFGRAGAVIVLAAIVAAIVLAVASVRRDRRTLAFATAGAALLVIALTAWWLIVYPINADARRAWLLAYPGGLGDVPVGAFRSPPENVVAVWERLRNRWEWGHVTVFLFDLAGFVALAIAAVNPRPTTGDRPPEEAGSTN